MDWLAFAGSVIGGLIGGLFTFFGVKFTIKHEDQKKLEEEHKKIIESRPRLELISYKDIKDTKVNSKADLNAVVLHIENVKNDKERIYFSYDEKGLDLNNLVCLEYKFKNTGKTEIDDISVVCNLPKDTAIIDLNQREFYIKESLLNYTVWSEKRFIKSGETVVIKIYYIKDKIITGMISAPFGIYLRDINGRYWVQALFAPTKEIENSSLISYKEYRNASDIDIAIDCFRGKKFW